MALFNKPKAAAATVDGIMAAFNQTISDLEAVEQAEKAREKAAKAAQPSAVLPTLNCSR